MTTLRVRVLGELALELDGRPLPPPASRRARELLGWLALHPGPQQRSTVAAALWPDVLDSSARASLRTTLHELRAALGPAAGHLVADRATVTLEDVSVDARELDAGDLAARGGEVLEGLDADWVYGERDRLRQRVLDLLEQAIAAAADPAEAVRLARERAELDPLSEEAGRELMRRLALAGDRAAAAEAYERLRERLRTGLGLAPSAPTRELLEQLRAGLGEAPTRVLVPPAPALRLPLTRGPLVGRDDELARLVSALDRAAAGERIVALVEGEAGIGKTRLLAELCRVAHERGATVRFGRCQEEPLGPYQPVAEALGGELAHEASEAEGARWRLFEAIDALLAGDAAPVVLALDDLHWAEAATLRLVGHLARSPRPARLLIALAYRDDAVRGTPLAALLADLRRNGPPHRTRLLGLTEPDVAALAGDDELARTLHVRTRGNPFFVEELLRHLADHAGEPAEAALPEGVKDAVAARLDRMGEDVRRVLAVAAVAGAEFELELLERVTGEVDVLTALDTAAAAQAIHEQAPGRYAFVHALVRDVLYDELSLARRARLHGAIADALEPTQAPLAELAHHRLEAAALGDTEAAVKTAAAAAQAARAALAYEDAAALYERALAVDQGPPGRRCELLLALGEARARAGEPAQEPFAAAAAVARAMPDPELLARAALGHSGLGVTIIAIDERSIALLEEALALLPATGALRARVVARLAIETYHAKTPEERCALGDEAVALARAAGDEGALVQALGALRVALWSPAYLDERLRTDAEMLAAAERAGDVEGVLQARNWLVADRFEQGDLEAMRGVIEAHEALAAELRLPSYRWWGPMWRSSLAIEQGRFAEAERLIDEFAALGSRIGDPNARLYEEVQRLLLLRIQDRHEEVPAVERFERARERPVAYVYACAGAWSLACAGRSQQARELLHLGLAGLREDMNLLDGLAELALALEALGEGGPAAAVYERLAPYAGRRIPTARGAAGFGSVDHYLGLLAELDGRPQPAIRHFERALADNEAAGARPFVARTRLALGRLRADRGQLEQAEREARELGLARLADAALTLRSRLP